MAGSKRGTGQNGHLIGGNLCTAPDFTGYLQGAAAWAPDGKSLTIAAEDHGVTHLMQIPVDGHPRSVFVTEYAPDPTWAPDGSFVVYSGPDIGTVFTVSAANAEAGVLFRPRMTHLCRRGQRPVSDVSL